MARHERFGHTTEHVPTSSQSHLITQLIANLDYLSHNYVASFPSWNHLSHIKVKIVMPRKRLVICGL
jgi:hypothetical protein